MIDIFFLDRDRVGVLVILVSVCAEMVRVEVVCRVTVLDDTYRIA